MDSLKSKGYDCVEINERVFIVFAKQVAIYKIRLKMAEHFG